MHRLKHWTMLIIKRTLRKFKYGQKGVANASESEWRVANCEGRVARGEGRVANCEGRVVIRNT